MWINIQIRRLIPDNNTGNIPQSSSKTRMNIDFHIPPEYR